MTPTILAAPTTSRRRRIRRAVLSGVAAALAAASVAAPVTHAAPNDPPTIFGDNFGDFYTVPDSLPSTHGAVLKTQETNTYIRVPGVDPIPAPVTRTMFSTTDEDGRITPVTGALLRSTQPWTRAGERPLVVLAPGTMGQGDRCAPSRSLSTSLTVKTTLPLSASLNYEALMAAALSTKGYDVFLTDYIGLGMAGIHTYINRVEGGHAVLDAARAARTLTNRDDDAVVGIAGYSQGGGAAAAAAELAATYTPETNLKGTYAGAPPADLTKVLPHIDKSSMAGFIGYAVNGFVARNPELKSLFEKLATDKGVEALEQIKEQCTGDTTLSYVFRSTREWTKSGNPVSQDLNALPEVKSILDENRIGRVKPTGSVLVLQGVNDDVIPVGQARRLVEDWCALGGNAAFRADYTPEIPGKKGLNHIAPVLGNIPLGTDWLANALESTVPQGCQEG